MTSASTQIAPNAPAPTRSRNDTAIIALAGAASVIMLIIAATARIPNYRINPIFLIPLAWLPYAIRRRLHLHALHYALLVAAILLHDLGAYGWYLNSPLPISWDILVHFYFAIPVTLVLHRAIAHQYGGVLRPWQVALTALMFMMGFGALHEIMEYATYLIAGEEHGMLKPSASYFLDTQRDLTNNLLGTTTALFVLIVARLLRGRRAAR